MDGPEDAMDNKLFRTKCVGELLEERQEEG